MIFCRVVRTYRGKSTVLFEGDNVERAWRTWREKYNSGPYGTLRDGDLTLHIDGELAAAFSGGYNRTRW